MELNEAIKHCKEKAKELNDTADNWKRLSDEKGLSLPSDYEPCKECAAEHEQLAGWLTELQERREADKWIPVSERLPEIATSCLVQLSNGYITIGKYHSVRGGSWAFIDIGIQFVYPKDSVIAWKPLPKPYESEAVRND